MDIESFRDYCLSKQGTEETFPFGEDTLVFKVLGKVYALTNLKKDTFEVNLKCKPSKAIALRSEYPGYIRGGYHMNKRLWNTIDFEAFTDDVFLTQLIDHSYDLAVAKLPKKHREALNK